mgnify:CR=1 FL=1
MKKLLLVFTLCLLNQTLKAQDEFITIWQSTEEYPSIKIPTHNNVVYNYNVNWGDGSESNNVTGDISHQYAATGNYTVTITGIFPGMHFGKIYSLYGSYNATGIISIEQWGNNLWQKLESAFYGQTSLVINANDIPDLRACSSLGQMFRGCKSINNGSHNRWNEWNTSSIRKMFGLFQDSNFNQNINDWNVNNVTSMRSMFKNSNFNQELNNWDVSNVKQMGYMFSNTTSFNKNINSWNVSNVTDMPNMFSYSVFNQNINNWDVSNVSGMSNLFFKANSFNQPLNNWNVSKVKNMSKMFKDATAFNQDISAWNLESIEDCLEMFNGVTLSNANYEALLIGWNNQDLNQNIVFDGGNSNYFSNDAETARQNMIDNDNWTITDGGKSAPLKIDTIDVTTIKIYKSDNSTIQINKVSNGTLNIYSITGKHIIKNIKINSNSETIQIPKIATGLYLIKINFEDKEFVKKILF